MVLEEREQFKKNLDTKMRLTKVGTRENESLEVFREEKS